MRITVAVAQDVRVTHEVLETGQERPQRAAPAGLFWVVGLTVVVLMTVVNVAIAVEWATRSTEASNLITAVERSEQAMKGTQTQFNDALAAYDSENLSDTDRERLRRELSEIALAGETAIAAAGVDVADVRILPWHVQLLQAREAYLAHNRAWVEYMAAAAADPAEWFRPQPLVNSTFADAKLPLVEAVPLLDPFNTLERIELIYVTGSGDSGGGQSA